MNATDNRIELALAVLTFEATPARHSHGRAVPDDVKRSGARNAMHWRKSERAFYDSLNALCDAADAYAATPGAMSDEAASAFILAVYDAAPIVRALQAAVRLRAAGRDGMDPYALALTIPKYARTSESAHSGCWVASYGEALRAAHKLYGAGFDAPLIERLVHDAVEAWEAEAITLKAAPAAPATVADLVATIKREAATTKAVNPKDAASADKLAITCVPLNVVGEIALGMMEGARKYGRHNYREAGALASVQINAALRHLAAWWEGEDTDPASGISHVSKAMSALTILRDAQMRGGCVDDRPPATPGDWLATQNATAAALSVRYPNALPAHTNATAPSGQA